jgi:hypothetical protein
LLFNAVIQSHAIQRAQPVANRDMSVIGYIASAPDERDAQHRARALRCAQLAERELRDEVRPRARPC